jgi:hypothetical protein
MGRRYLTQQEGMSALNRGNSVEAFLGGFSNQCGECIRWVSFSKTDSGVLAKVWESLDEGSEDFLDVYSFSPANGEWDEPVKIIEAASIEEASKKLEREKINLVNSGVVQDEYADYIKKIT